MASILVAQEKGKVEPEKPILEEHSEGIPIPSTLFTFPIPFPPKELAKKGLLLALADREVFSADPDRAGLPVPFPRALLPMPLPSAMDANALNVSNDGFMLPNGADAVELGADRASEKLDSPVGGGSREASRDFSLFIFSAI